MGHCEKVLERFVHGIHSLSKATIGSLSRLTLAAS